MQGIARASLKPERVPPIRTTGSLLTSEPPRRKVCAAGERPAEGRAATTRFTPSVIAVPKMALETGLWFYATQTFRRGLRR